jgi:uncharacterized membrane protein (UPF0127 family)
MSIGRSIISTIYIFAVAFLLAGCNKLPANKWPDGSHICVQIGQQFYSLAVARSDATRTKGLSSRLELDKNKGMIFVFDSVDYHSFWMKDTFIPLDIIWLDKNLRVVDQKTMSVETDTTAPINYYKPSRPAAFAIEVNRHNLGTNIIGSKIKIMPASACGE